MPMNSDGSSREKGHGRPRWCLATVRSSRCGSRLRPGEGQGAVTRLPLKQPSNLLIGHAVDEVEVDASVRESCPKLEHEGKFSLVQLVPVRIERGDQVVPSQRPESRIAHRLLSESFKHVNANFVWLGWGLLHRACRLPFSILGRTGARAFIVHGGRYRRVEIVAGLLTRTRMSDTATMFLKSTCQENSDRQDSVQDEGI